jgi:hypothetical protein
MQVEALRAEIAVARGIQKRINQGIKEGGRKLSVSHALAMGVTIPIAG